MRWQKLNLKENESKEHAGKKYSRLKNRQVMFEYVLLKGINDSLNDAYRLSNLLKGIFCKLNVIPYNETGGEFQRTEREKIEAFTKVLYENRDKCRILIRWSKGQDIAAGCGQLAGQTV